MSDGQGKDAKSQLDEAGRAEFHASCERKGQVREISLFDELVNMMQLTSPVVVTERYLCERVYYVVNDLERADYGRLRDLEIKFLSLALQRVV